MVLIAAAAMVLAPIGGGSLSAAPPPDGGTISLEPRTADGDYDPSMHSFVDAAARALAARGFTVLDDAGHAAYVAELILSRAEVGTELARDPAGGHAVMPAGVGVVVPFSTGKSSLVPLLRTRLELRIHKRGVEGIVWDGTAVTVRAAGTDEAVASDLSEAVVRTYPAEPPGVVGVP